MRSLIVASSLFLTVVLNFGCKKGEDDPAFTLLSRKARVEGDWKMSEGTLTIGYKDATGLYPAELITYTEDAYTDKVLSRGATFEGIQSLSIQMTKKGGFIMKQTVDSINIEFSGTWQFEGKSSGSKNKEIINIQLVKASNSSGYWGTFNKAKTNFRYRIKELRSKKMVLTCEEEMLDINSIYGVYITSEYTFVQ